MEWAETREGAKGHIELSLLCPFASELCLVLTTAKGQLGAPLRCRTDFPVAVKTSDITAAWAACFDGVIAWV